jgi:arylmalonate decarboxylase
VTCRPTSRKPRIGCIVPATNVMAEEDFIALCPKEAGVHFARADFPADVPLALQFEAMADTAPHHARTLAKAGVGVVAFACTSASFHKGPGSDRAISRAMEAAAGVPAVTAAEAVVAALRALGARRVAVAAPYLPWVIEAERRFLEAAGFEVLAIDGLGLARPTDIQAVTTDEILALAHRVDRPSAEAILISCTDLASLGAVEPLEALLGKPVVTSNQATFWAALRRLGLGPIAGGGRLLATRLGKGRGENDDALAAMGP